MAAVVKLDYEHGSPKARRRLIAVVAAVSTASATLCGHVLICVLAAWVRFSTGAWPTYNNPDSSVALSPAIYDATWIILNFSLFVALLGTMTTWFTVAWAWRFLRPHEQSALLLTPIAAFVLFVIYLVADPFGHVNWFVD